MLQDFNTDDRLLKLEDLFFSSPYSWKWLRREAFCPHLPKAEEADFFLAQGLPDEAKATLLVNMDADFVFGKDAGVKCPDASRLGGLDEGLEQAEDSIQSKRSTSIFPDEG